MNNANFINIAEFIAKCEPLGGIALIFTIIGLIVLLYIKTGGRFNRAQWFIVFVAVAMVTGLSFWIFTESSGKVAVKGVELGGGAAIGAGFMLLSWGIISSDKFHKFLLPFTIVVIPTEKYSKLYRLVDKSSEIVNNQDLPGGRMLFEFGEGHFAGSIKLRHFTADFNKFEDVRYRIDRAGRIKPLYK